MISTSQCNMSHGWHHFCTRVPSDTKKKMNSLRNCCHERTTKTLSINGTRFMSSWRFSAQAFYCDLNIVQVHIEYFLLHTENKNGKQNTYNLIYVMFFVSVSTIHRKYYSMFWLYMMAVLATVRTKCRLFHNKIWTWKIFLLGYTYRWAPE